MLTYQKAQELMRHARDSARGRPIANNTRLVQRGACYAVKLHDTDVVTLHPSGAVTLNSGGWRTVTTKGRINAFSPAAVYSHKGEWRVAYNGEYGLFRDGVRITGTGRIVGAGKLADSARERKLRKAIGAYAKEYVRRLYAGELGTPGPGDCWGCCMRDKATGKLVLGSGHIAEHVREGYYVPSLILLAFERMGASKAETHDAAYYLKCAGWEKTRPFWGPEHARYMAAKLRRYCLQQCGLSY